MTGNICYFSSALDFAWMAGTVAGDIDKRYDLEWVQGRVVEVSFELKILFA